MRRKRDLAKRPVVAFGAMLSAGSVLAAALWAPDDGRVPTRADAVRAGDEAGRPVVHYTFDDDDGGTVYDASGNDQDGRPVGDVAYETSFDGRAARFTSSRTYVVCGAERANMRGWRELTVSAWVLMKRYSTYGRVMNRGHVTNKGYGGFTLQVGGTYGGEWQPGNFKVYTNAALTGVDIRPATFAHRMTPHPQLGHWFHLVGTYDGETASFYVDGEQDTRADVWPPGVPVWDEPGTKLVIGNAACLPGINWTDNYFDGLIDDVRIWRRALSDREVAELHSAGRAKVEAGRSNTR